jgi:hypothetical protein
LHTLYKTNSFVSSTFDAIDSRLDYRLAVVWVGYLRVIPEPGAGDRLFPLSKVFRCTVEGFNRHSKIGMDWLREISTH